MATVLIDSVISSQRRVSISRNSFIEFDIIPESDKLLSLNKTSFINPDISISSVRRVLRLDDFKVKIIPRDIYYQKKEVFNFWDDEENQEAKKIKLSNQ